MNTRNIAIAILIGSAALSSAFAADTGKDFGGELGYVPAPFHGTLSRQQVDSDLHAFERKPVTADGGRAVGGETGYEFPQHSFGVAGGKLVHTDTLAHDAPKHRGRLSADELRAYQEAFPNG